MSKLDIDKAYVSPYDKFLHEFDKKNPKSASQLKEIEKHKKIFMQRDNEDSGSADQGIWSEF